MKKRFEELLSFLYGPAAGKETAVRLEDLLERTAPEIRAPERTYSGSLPLDETDAFVITYGDQFNQQGRRPLECLGEFADRYLSDIVSGVHILPFFPFSSDDGFSIIDYRKVNESYGTWEDVAKIGSRFRLMSDLVLNHCSAKSDWFAGFLRGDQKYRDFFITASPEDDLSMIVRPRALPLLTEFETAEGPRHVWTTFSADQVDLNFANPDVLLEMVDVFLFHALNGVQVIRLDAIAYAWKEIGHPSVHHEKTHAIVQLFRAVCDEYLPWVIIITETNVPHEENISYFGDGRNEAHMIYQFTLPPLTLDAFARGDSTYLCGWASCLPTADAPVTYFNFLASHDGIGVTPTHGILSGDELGRLVDVVRSRGGLVSYKATADGEIPYELNVNYRDAVTDHSLSDKERAKQFLASQAVILSMVGVPGIYIHSLVGSGNYSDGVKETGMNRTINREKLDFQRVSAELEDPATMRNMVYSGYRDMLKARRDCKAFHPEGAQRVIEIDSRLIAVLRTSPDGDMRVLCLINTTGTRVDVAMNSTVSGLTEGERLHDLLGGAGIEWRQGELAGSLSPWQVSWLASDLTEVLNE